MDRGVEEEWLREGADEWLLLLEEGDLREEDEWWLDEGLLLLCGE